jgi:peptide/nickel transport system substrate-binding protein
MSKSNSWRPTVRSYAGGLTSVVVVAGMAVGLSGCGASSSTDSADMLRIVLPAEPPTLDPCMNSQTSTGIVSRENITEGLTFRDPTTSEVKPLLATKWEQTDPQTWTFTLRDGVKFQDGSPFDADAVVASIQRTLEPKLSCDVAGQFFGEVKPTASAVTPTTVEIKTNIPDPILPLRISFIGITPKNTDPASRVRQPIGTGPYKIASWNAGTDLTLDRFDQYWGDKPAFPKARYVWRSEDSVRANMVQNNEADIATFLSANQKDAKGALTFSTNQVAYLRTDPTQAPMNDLRVRQAMDFAIDRAGLIGAVFGGVGEPASQIVPPGFIGHDDKLAPTPYDPEKAKALVAEAKAAGVPVDQPITFIGRNDIYPHADQAAEVIQSQLEAAGLKVDIKMLDVTNWLQYALRPFVPNMGPTLLQGQHGNQGGDASFTMANNYGSQGHQSTYGTPELDALITTAEQATGQQRQDEFAQALDLQHEIVRDVVLIDVGGVMALSPKVSYKPDIATQDEMRLADIGHGGA